ncbi:hypothetical protein CGCVW01_v008853 [Colletotrichum viniferum]|nr:hypothetical protein CGCVW01_v008853 [Colletotrichum viniferum]
MLFFSDKLGEAITALEVAVIEVAIEVSLRSPGYPSPRISPRESYTAVNKVRL